MQVLMTLALALWRNGAQVSVASFLVQELRDIQLCGCWSWCLDFSWNWDWCCSFKINLNNYVYLLFGELKQ